MAPKRNPASTPAAKSAPSPSPSTSTSTSTTPSTKPPQTAASTPSTRAGKSSSSSSTSSSATLTPHGTATEILTGVWNTYVSRTPQRVKLLDTFLAFLVLVGVLQFVYCVVGGNYPFNAFLSGFSATVGQFVLTASLRIQTNAENRAEFKAVSHERAFADYVFGSLILHFFCVNFIN